MAGGRDTLTRFAGADLAAGLVHVNCPEGCDGGEAVVPDDGVECECPACGATLVEQNITWFYVTRSHLRTLVAAKR